MSAADELLTRILELLQNIQFLPAAERDRLTTLFATYVSSLEKNVADSLLT